MAVDIVALLRDLDFSITGGTSSASWLLRASDGTSFEVAPSAPVERLTAHIVRNVIAHPRTRRSPLLVGESATEGVTERAKAGQVDILTAEPLRLIRAGIIYAVEDGEIMGHAGSASRRPAWTRWAVERYLLLAREPARQLTIAAALGTSQQSVSNTARHLGELATDHGSGLIAADRRGLLEHWLHEYPGPGGQEFGWYSLEPITEQTAKAVEVATLLDLRPLVSGDVAADRLAPWKLPARGCIYINGPIDLAGDGFVPAPVKESTLITCVPRDPSIWQLDDLRPEPDRPGEMALVDPVIVYWEMVNSADFDSEEAADHLAALIMGGRR